MKMNEKRKEQIEAIAKGFANLDSPKKNFVAGFIACSMMTGEEKDSQSKFELMKQFERLQPNI